MLPLTSLRLLVVAGLLLSALALFAIRAPRSRHPLLQRSLASLLAVLVGLAGVAAGVNRHFYLYRSWASLSGLHSRDLVQADGPADLRRALKALPVGTVARRHGQLLSLHIPGPTSRFAQPGRTLVYLPPQYGSQAWVQKGFPVVEALPGSPGRPTDYINGVRADSQLDQAIQAHRIPPVIVIFPPSNLGVFRSLECTNTADGLNDETYLTIDMRAWVDQHLSTNRQRWTTLGYSSGGYCALDLALRHPDLFGRAVSLDGYVHALDDHYARGLWGRGAAGRQRRLEHSPDWWVAHHPPEPVQMYLSAGTKDRDAAAAAIQFWGELQRTGWQDPHDVLTVEPDAHHTFRDWERAFIPSLQWALHDSASSPTDAMLALNALRKSLSECRSEVGQRQTASASPPPTVSVCRARRQHTMHSPRAGGSPSPSRSAASASPTPSTPSPRSPSPSPLSPP